MSASSRPTSLDALVWRVGPMREKLARYTDHTTLSNLAITSKDARSAMRRPLTEANRQLLTRIVGKRTADLYYKMVDIETRDDGVVYISTSRIPDVDEDDDLPFDNMGFWLLRTAAVRNGCIYISGPGGRYIIPGIPSEYTFYESLYSESVIAAPKTKVMSERYRDRKNDDPTKVLNAFPICIWIRYPWKASDTNVHVYNYSMRREFSVFENVFTCDMECLPILPNEERDARMREGIERDMRAAYFPPETIEGGTLNPEFTKAYSDRMYAAITEHANGVFEAAEGTRVFATWAEAMNFKWSDTGKDIVIEFV